MCSKVHCCSMHTNEKMANSVIGDESLNNMLDYYSQTELVRGKNKVRYYLQAESIPLWIESIMVQCVLVVVTPIYSSGQSTAILIRRAKCN